MMWCAERPIKNSVAWSWPLSVQGCLLMMVAFVLVFAACKKQEEAKKPETPELPAVHADRSQDKDYIAALMANRQQQTKEARERLALSIKMTQCVARVRATLPPDAPAETLQKALEADQDWKALDTQIRQAEATSKETLRQAEALVRKRMQDELRDNQAIQQGKAKAIETAKPTVPLNKK
jgi:hypothetical protein